MISIDDNNNLYSYTIPPNRVPAVEIWDDFKVGDEVVAIASHATCDKKELSVVRGETFTFMVQHGDKYCKLKNSDGRSGFLPLSHISLKEDYHEEKWYLDVCTRKIAEAVVNSKSLGSYLIWRSDKNHKHIIITIKTETAVDHIELETRGSRIMLEDRMYKSLRHAVVEFRNEKILNEPIEIKFPFHKIRENPAFIAKHLILTGHYVTAIEDVMQNCKLHRKYNHIIRIIPGHLNEVIGTLPDRSWYLVRDQVTGIEGFISSECVTPHVPPWYHGKLDRTKIDSILNTCENTCSFLVAKIADNHNETSPFVLAILDPQRKVEVFDIEYKDERVSCFHSVRESVTQLINDLLIARTIPMLRYPIINRKSCSSSSEMDIKSLEAYFSALEQGVETDYNLRLMIVGHYGVGKSTFARKLLCKSKDKIQGTQGIETSVSKACIDIKTGEWKVYAEEEQDKILDERMVHVLRQTSTTEDHKNISSTSERTKDGYDVIDDLHVEVREGYATEQKVYDNKMVQMRPVKKENSLEKRRRAVSENDKYNHQENGKMEVLRYSYRELTPDKRKRISDIVKRSSQKSLQYGLVTVWEVEGDFMYNASHQVLLARNAIYCVLFDISKSLDDTIEVAEHQRNSNHQHHHTNRTIIEYWLQSIHTQKGADIGDMPPVVLVGTNKDKIPCCITDKEEYIINYFEAIRSMFDNSPLINHIQPEQICLDSTTDETNVQQFRKLIFNVAKRMPWWGKLKPAKWINLEQVIIMLKKSRPIVQIQDVYDADIQSELPVHNKEEVLAFLRTQHNSGNLVFFEGDGFEQTVVLNPQWIIDGFRSIVFPCDAYCRDAKLRPFVQDLSDKAILHKEYINHLWKLKEFKTFADHKDILLLYMTHLGIIAKGNVVTGKGDFYFVPSLLQEFKTEEDLEFQNENPENETFDGTNTSTPGLFIRVESSSFNQSLFSGVMADCLSRWQPIKQGSAYKLYNKGGLFSLDKSRTHVMQLRIISLEKNAVHIVCKIQNVINCAIDVRKCDNARRFLLSSVKSHLNRQNLDNLEVYIQCMHPNVTDVLGSLNSRELLDTYSKIGCHGHSTAIHKHATDTHKLLSFWYPDGLNKEDYTSLKQWVDKAPEYVNDRKLSDTDLEKLVSALGFGWEHIGISLGVSSTEMDQYKLDFPQRTHMQIYTTLLKWKRRSSRPVTFLMLVKALFENERVHVDWDRVKNVGEGVDC